MEYLARSRDLPNHLRRGVGAKWNVVRHYFLDFGVDKHICNTFEGFLRSLLYQLLDVSRGDEEEEKVHLPRSEPEKRWSTRALQERLSILLKQRSNPICILLDGLDEYHGNQWDLTHFLREMAIPRVKLCVAGRPGPVFDSAFKDLPTLTMQDYNRSGIDRMVTLTIQRSVAGSGFYDDKDVVQLAQEITEKAHGVFLWARFAIDELRDGWSVGLDLAALQKRLENVPDELEHIYARIFRKMRPEQCQEAAQMLQLVCYAYETLSLRQLYVAMELAAGRQGPLGEQISARDMQQFRRRILAATAGVLEVFRYQECGIDSPMAFGSHESHESQGTVEVDPHNSRETNENESHESQGTGEYLVNVIHRTLRTYLNSKGWFHILGVAHEGMLHAQVLWLRVCAGIFPPAFKGLPPAIGNEWMQRRIYGRLDPSGLLYTTVDLLSTRSLGSDQHSGMIDKTSPLLKYAAMYMLHHAAEVEQRLSLAVYNMLQRGMSDSFVCYHRFHWAERRRACQCFDMCPEPLHSLHLAIAHGLDGYVKDFLSTICEKGSRRSREWDDVFSLKVPYEFLDLDGRYHDGHPQDLESLRRDPDYFRMSLLEFAIYHASKRFTYGGDRASQTRIAAIVLDHQPCVSDAAMIFALENSSPEVVRLLLPYCSDGKMVLKKTLKLDPDIKDWISLSGLSEICQERFDVGPMWCIARRHGGSWTEHHDLADVVELIDLFVGRGEDINDQCGPFGTALHAALCGKIFSAKRPNLGMCKLLVSRGANVNASGPLGTPLELAWRVANTGRDSHNINLSRLGLFIKWLIENGAVNNRCDPNGYVPSRERMLAFAESDSIEIIYISDPDPEESEEEAEQERDYNQEDRSRGESE